MVFNDAECHRIGQSLDEQIQSMAVDLIVRKSQYVLVFVNIKAQKDCTYSLLVLSQNFVY